MAAYTLCYVLRAQKTAVQSPALPSRTYPGEQGTNRNTWVSVEIEIAITAMKKVIPLRARLKHRESILLDW